MCAGIVENASYILRLKNILTLKSGYQRGEHHINVVWGVVIESLIPIFEEKKTI